jgi:hypothetical protein
VAIEAGLGYEDADGVLCHAGLSIRSGLLRGYPLPIL